MARRRSRSRSRGRRRGRSFWSLSNWMNLAFAFCGGYVLINAFGDKVPVVKDTLDDVSGKLSEMADKSSVSPKQE